MEHSVVLEAMTQAEFFSIRTVIVLATVSTCLRLIVPDLVELFRTTFRKKE